MDSLSLARMGVKVTGIDFSENAIETAKALNDELKLDAEFICSSVYNLKENLNKKYDIVFTSYGVIGWLPNLNKWGEIISHFLKPGGIFFIAEFHPVIWMFDDEVKKFKYSYFNREVIEETISGTYADRNANISGKEYGWNHSLDEVFTSLMKHGLTIKSFRELSFSFYDCFNNTVKGDDGYFRIKGLEDIIPMMYSIKSIKS